MGETKPIRIFGIADDSIVDGPGIRLAIFTQGCSHACKACHNPEAQPFEGGKLYTPEELLQKVRANPLISGITLTGGEPFEQAEELLPFLEAFRAMDTPGISKKPLTVWAYSGYTFEQLMAGVSNEFSPKLLQMCDVLVDGLFVESLKSIDLLWRGSSNQRIIDVQASLSSGTVILCPSLRGA